MAICKHRCRERERYASLDQEPIGPGRRALYWAYQRRGAKCCWQPDRYRRYARRLPPPLSATSRRDSLPQGSTSPIVASVGVTLTGSGSGTNAWTAAHGSSSWLTLTTSQGNGSGTVEWRINPAGLTAGLHVDTVTVSVAAAQPIKLEFIDVLRIYGPAVDVSCATDALLGAVRK